MYRIILNLQSSNLDLPYRRADAVRTFVARVAQALPVDSPESAKVAAQEAKLAPLTDLLSATAAQHHVDLAERRKGNRSDDYKALEKEIELAVGAKK